MNERNPATYVAQESKRGSMGKQKGEHGKAKRGARESRKGSTGKQKGEHGKAKRGVVLAPFVS